MGFVFGTLCLMGLVALAASGGSRRHRRGWHHHHGHARHGGRCGGGGRWRGRGRWRDRDDDERDEQHDGEPGAPPWRAGRAEDFVSAALDGVGLREEQRPYVEGAVKDAGKAVKNFVEHLEDSRSDLFSAVRGDAIDEAKLAAVFEWHDDALAEARKEVVEALKKVHAALDPEQRSRFADAVGARGVPFV